MDICVRAGIKLDESGRRCQNFLFVSVVRHVTRLVFDGWLPYRLCWPTWRHAAGSFVSAGSLWFSVVLNVLNVVFVWTNGLLMNVFLCPTLLLNEHLCTLSEFIFIYLVFFFFRYSTSVAEFLTSVAYKSLWYNQNKSPTRGPLCWM